MAPRHYTLGQRAEARNETRQRIVDATVALHARKGAAATTYADIAAAADVAVPTVYNHFPTRAELLAGCISHVTAGAPLPEGDPFAHSHSLRDRIHIAATSLFALYEYLEPWLSWSVREIAQVPELLPFEERRREFREALVRRAFEPRFGKRMPPAVFATASALLDFPSWLTLSAHTGKKNAARVASEALAAVAMQHKPRARARKENAQ
jgi:AcrR family transcriptional regulator